MKPLQMTDTPRVLIFFPRIHNTTDECFKYLAKAPDAIDCHKKGPPKIFSAEEQY